MAPWSWEMDFDSIHREGIEHQAADVLPLLPITGDDSTSMHEVLPGMAVVSSPKQHEKVGTETTDVIEDYNDNGSNLISPGLPAVCPKLNAKTEMQTTPPTLTHLLAKQGKEAF